MNNIKVTDHLGNKFDSFKELAAYWNISPSLLANRRARGMSLQAALTVPKKVHSISITDPDGNTFSSKSKMFKAYGVDIHVAFARMHYGHTIEDILQNGAKRPLITPRVDHTGKRYPTVTAMCAAYGISCPLLHSRLKAGCSLKQALTLKIGKYTKGKTK